MSMLDNRKVGPESFDTLSHLCKLHEELALKLAGLKWCIAGGAVRDAI